VPHAGQQGHTRHSVQQRPKFGLKYVEFR
jgi:hypothetical protein